MTPLLELAQVCALGIIAFLAEQARRASVTAVALAVEEKKEAEKKRQWPSKKWSDWTTPDLERALREAELMADIMRHELTRRAAGIGEVT